MNQFIPWIRLDGYYVVSDLIGVSDLFSRIGPTLRSLVPGRETDPRVRQLKPWARVAVTIWVVNTLVVIVVAVVVFATEAPAYAQRAWTSLYDQFATLASGGAVDVLAGGLGVLLLILPAAGLLFTYVLLCTQAGSLVAIARCSARGRGYAPVTSSTPSGRAHPCEGAARVRGEASGGVEDPVCASA